MENRNLSNKKRGAQRHPFFISSRQTSQENVRSVFCSIIVLAFNISPSHYTCTIVSWIPARRPGGQGFKNKRNTLYASCFT